MFSTKISFIAITGEIGTQLKNKLNIYIYTYKKYSPENSGIMMVFRLKL